jgi:nicotinamidase-related amidase
MERAIRRLVMTTGTTERMVPHASLDKCDRGVRVYHLMSVSLPRSGKEGRTHDSRSTMW